MVLSSPLLSSPRLSSPHIPHAINGHDLDSEIFPFSTWQSLWHQKISIKCVRNVKKGRSKASVTNSYTQLSFVLLLSIHVLVRDRMVISSLFQCRFERVNPSSSSYSFSTRVKSCNVIFAFLYTSASRITLKAK